MGQSSSVVVVHDIKVRIHKSSREINILKPDESAFKLKRSDWIALIKVA